MATTRTFKSLGVFAEDANTVIPVTPVPGVAYRNTNTSEVQNKEGFTYASPPPDSAMTNQKLYISTSFTDTIDRHGIPGWSDQVNYDVPAIVWGTDGEFYYALQESGPGTGAGVQDPITSPAYWTLTDSTDELKAELAEQSPTIQGTRLVGHSNFTLASWVPFATARIDTTLIDPFIYRRNVPFINLFGGSPGLVEVGFTPAQPNTLFGVQVTPMTLGATLLQTAQAIDVVANYVTLNTYEVQANGNNSLTDISFEITFYTASDIAPLAYNSVNLFVHDGEPSIKDLETGIYLFKEKEEIYVLGANEPNKIIKLSDKDKMDYLKGIEWPDIGKPYKDQKEKDKHFYTRITLSDDSLKFLVNACQKYNIKSNRIYKEEEPKVNRM